MFPRARNELISEEVEVTLVHRHPSSSSSDADRFAARVHVTAGTIRLRPIDSTKRGIKMNTALFAGPPSAPPSVEEEKEGGEEKLEEKEEDTLMATLHIKDELETVYKTALFKLAARPDAFEQVAEKFRNLLHYAWCEPPMDPATHSQPLPLKETSQCENGGEATPSLKRSATSPTSSEASSYLTKAIAKMSRSSSKRACYSVSASVREEERGASSEEGGMRSELKSVEEYRTLAKFFEEVASSVYRLDQSKRARIVRIVTDLVELTAEEK